MEMEKGSKIPTYLLGNRALGNAAVGCMHTPKGVGEVGVKLQGFTMYSEQEGTSVGWSCPDSVFAGQVFLKEAAPRLPKRNAKYLLHGSFPGRYCVDP